MAKTNLSYWDIQSQIEKPDIQPAYLFCGEELFLKRGITEKLRLKVIADDTQDFNYNYFYADDVDFGMVLDTARTQPFIGNMRLIIVKDADKLSVDNVEALGRYLQSPANWTCLVLDSDKPASHKIVSAISALTATVVFSQLKGKDINLWVADYVKSKKKNIAQNAIYQLVERVGYELDILAMALDKLCLYAGESKNIETATISEMVSKTKVDNRFVFLDALANKNVSSALSMVGLLSQEGREAAGIIGLINSRFKLIENYKRLKNRGYAHADIADELNISKFYFEKITKQAENFKEEELGNCFRILLDSDVSIKTGLSSPVLTLETLVVKICSNK